MWSYWEDQPGQSREVYLDVCLETISRHAPPLELRCLGRDDALRWLPDLDVERWRSLPAPNYRSDYLRSRVLQRYGGVWVDVDTVVLSPLVELLECAEGKGPVSFGREHHRFFGGLCAAVAGSPFVDAWVEEQDRVLTRHNDWSTLGYAALAQDVTWGVARREQWTSLPMGRVAPVPWYQWRRFFSRVESPGRLLAAQPITVVLWNAVMSPRLRPWDRGRLLRSHTLVSRLIRIGLGRSQVEDEEDLLTRFHALSELRFSVPAQRLELGARRLVEKGTSR
ncbi:MAG TPA: glycosyltransferase [Acidimicrobiales bacterium]|nr:glycosyltransferase [Acidimicrobiales bacterium]